MLLFAEGCLSLVCFSSVCCIMIWAPSLTRYLNAEQELRNLDFQSPTAALVHEEGIQPQRVRQQTRVQLSQRTREMEWGGRQA